MKSKQKISKSKSKNKQIKQKSTKSVGKREKQLSQQQKIEANQNKQLMEKQQILWSSQMNTKLIKIKQNQVETSSQNPQAVVMQNRLTALSKWNVKITQQSLWAAFGICRIQCQSHAFSMINFEKEILGQGFYLIDQIFSYSDSTKKQNNKMHKLQIRENQPWITCQFNPVSHALSFFNNTTNQTLKLTIMQCPEGYSYFPVIMVRKGKVITQGFILKQ